MTSLTKQPRSYYLRKRDSFGWSTYEIKEDGTLAISYDYIVNLLYSAIKISPQQYERYLALKKLSGLDTARAYLDSIP